MRTRLLAVAAETPSPSPAPTRYIDPQAVTPGFVGFVIFLALAVATFFLWRSMNKQLKRVDFDEGQDTEQGGKTAGDPPRASDDADSGPRDTRPPESDERPVDLRDKS